MNARTWERYAAWITVVTGLCVFVLRYASPRPSFDVHRNLFFTGLVVMFVGLASVIANEGGASWNYWSAINIAVGAWLVVSASLIPPVPSVAFAQDCLGAVVAIVSLVAVVGETVYQRTSAKRLKRDPSG